MNFSIQACGKDVQSLRVVHGKSLAQKVTSVGSLFDTHVALWKTLVVHNSYAGYLTGFTQLFLTGITEVRSRFSPRYTYPTITTTKEIFIK